MVYVWAVYVYTVDFFRLFLFFFWLFILATVPSNSIHNDMMYFVGMFFFLVFTALQVIFPLSSAICFRHFRFSHLCAHELFRFHYHAIYATCMLHSEFYPSPIVIETIFFWWLYLSVDSFQNQEYRLWYFDIVPFF